VPPGHNLVCRTSRSWCIMLGMARITVDVNEKWLEAAQVVLGTDTKVATINEALRAQALKAEAAEIVAAFDSVAMDFTGSADGFRYGGGRDLSRLAGDARPEHVPAGTRPGPRA
jgi:Arc/MetJ family transcription regulator